MSNDTALRFSTRLFHCLKYRDAAAAIDWLERTLGLEVVFRVDDDAGRVAHSQLAWPGGGGVMLGSADAGSADFTPGSGLAYLVSDDIDAAYARAVDAGAEIERPLGDTDYGSREFGLRDPEGNQWAVGDYPGEPLPER